MKCFTYEIKEGEKEKHETREEPNPEFHHCQEEEPKGEPDHEQTEGAAIHFIFCISYFIFEA